MTPHEPSPPRRLFFLSVIYGLWGLIAAALALPASIYLLLPPRLRKREEWTEAADLAKLPSRTPAEVVFRHNRVDGWKVTSERTTAWAIKISDSEVIALAPQCTHLGCAYHWDEGKRQFLCPCHTSTFSQEGKVLSGPAPRPLDRYEVRIENGKLLVGRIVESEGAA
jgi:menaquinol-cytochrome c reductase iron-sulfur subunit